jgi:hypothetical protein
MRQASEAEVAHPLPLGRALRRTIRSGAIHAVPLGARSRRLPFSGSAPFRASHPIPLTRGGPTKGEALPDRQDQRTAHSWGLIISTSHGRTAMEGALVGLPRRVLHKLRRHRSELGTRDDFDHRHRHRQHRDPCPNQSETPRCCRNGPCSHGTLARFATYLAVGAGLLAGSPRSRPVDAVECYGVHVRREHVAGILATCWLRVRPVVRGAYDHNVADARVRRADESMIAVAARELPAAGRSGDRFVADSIVGRSQSLRRKGPPA